eukprot:CAMPEP_0184693602 /NCGR_PEP_ID=MMETSP0313-20130426/1778_1 /TAXON_ID=2792 /ORGANISM="Porphyridium aerugineum, Strain SAG 1380-2" /LENGTH=719 /DNA_ID=CAMNT_0027151715 /DNA_START=603 /DNA_END=2762 /DNA_ORIENTATION=+
MAVFSSSPLVAAALLPGSDSKAVQHLAFIIGVIGFAGVDFSLNTVMWPLRALLSDVVRPSQQHAVQSSISVLSAGAELCASLLVALIPQAVSQVGTIYGVAMGIFVVTLTVSLITCDEHKGSLAAQTSGISFVGPASEGSDKRQGQESNVATIPARYTSAFGYLGNRRTSMQRERSHGGYSYLNPVPLSAPDRLNHLPGCTLYNHGTKGHGNTSSASSTASAPPAVRGPEHEVMGITRDQIEARENAGVEMIYKGRVAARHVRYFSAPQILLSQNPLLYSMEISSTEASPAKDLQPAETKPEPKMMTSNYAARHTEGASQRLPAEQTLMDRSGAEGGIEGSNNALGNVSRNLDLSGSPTISQRSLEDRYSEVGGPDSMVSAHSEQSGCTCFLGMHPESLESGSPNIADLALDLSGSEDGNEMNSENSAGCGSSSVDEENPSIAAAPLRRPLLHTEGLSRMGSCSPHSPLVRSRDSRSRVRIARWIARWMPQKEIPKPFLTIAFVFGLSWFAWFCCVPYFSSWMGTSILKGSPTAPRGSEQSLRYQEGVSLYSACNAVKAVLTLFLAMFYPPILARYGERLLLTIAFGVFAVLLLIGGLTRHADVASATVVFLAIPSVATNSVCIALVAERYADNRGTYLGMLNMFAVVPQITDTLYSGTVSKYFGESSLFLVGSLWALLASLAAFSLLPLEPRGLRRKSPRFAPVRPGPANVRVVYDGQ